MCGCLEGAFVRDHCPSRAYTARTPGTPLLSSEAQAHSILHLRRVESKLAKSLWLSGCVRGRGSTRGGEQEGVGPGAARRCAGSTPPRRVQPPRPRPREPAKGNGWILWNSSPQSSPIRATETEVVTGLRVHPGPLVNHMVYWSMPWSILDYWCTLVHWSALVYWSMPWSAMVQPGPRSTLIYWSMP